MKAEPKTFKISKYLVHDKELAGFVGYMVGITFELKK